MSEVMTVQIFIGTVSLLGSLVGSFILCRKYRRICDTFLYDEEKAKIFHSRVQVYQILILSCFIYGLLEALTLGQRHGAIPYTAVIAALFACFLNCVTGVVQGILASHFVSAEIITDEKAFVKGLVRMGMIELIPIFGFILYVIGWKI